MYGSPLDGVVIVMTSARHGTTCTCMIMFEPSAFLAARSFRILMPNSRAECRANNHVQQTQKLTKKDLDILARYCQEVDGQRPPLISGRREMADNQRWAGGGWAVPTPPAVGRRWVGGAYTSSGGQALGGRCLHLQQWAGCAHASSDRFRHPIHKFALL